MHKNINFKKMLKFPVSFILIVIFFTLFLVGCKNKQVDENFNTLQALQAPAEAGFARALLPRPFVFPEDHGAHPTFRNEWWYVTGNVETADKRAFGYQFTIFRTALRPSNHPELAVSAFASQEIYMLHASVSDIANKRFYTLEDFARGGALQLAGANDQSVWLKINRLSWDDQTFFVTVRAEDFAFSLRLTTQKLPVLQGEAGLSQKSQEPGNASYYYSLTRLHTEGEITLKNKQKFQVQGDSWLDREWSTSALGAGQVGWDWLALQLDNKQELMLYQMRQAQGIDKDFSWLTIIDAEGKPKRYPASAWQLTVLGHWQSPTGTCYPVRWRLRLPEQALDVIITPRFSAQEHSGIFRYWEGAVGVQGQVAKQEIVGKGYVELTGYEEKTPCFIW
jgi:predicted secreted hydrolase